MRLQMLVTQLMIGLREQRLHAFDQAAKVRGQQRVLMVLSDDFGLREQRLHAFDQAAKAITEHH